MASDDVRGDPAAEGQHGASGNGAGGAGGAGGHNRAPPPGRGARRVGRILLWCGLGLVVTAALASAAVVVVLGDLARPRIKNRIQGLVQEHAGVALDYQALEVAPLQGLRARSFRILQPPKFRAATEEFLRIDELELRVQPWALARGERAIESVRASGVMLTLVRDEHGASSITELLAEKAAEPEPEQAAGKLSESLSQLPSLDVAQLSLENMRARMIELRDAAPPRTSSLASLDLRGRVHSEPGSLRGTALELKGSPQLRIERQDAAQKQFAEIELSIGARAESAEAISLQMRSELIDQNLWPELQHVVELLHLSAEVGFDAPQKRTSIRCHDIRGLAQMITGQLDVGVLDAEQLRVTADGALRFDGERLPVRPEGLRFEALALTLQAEQFAWQAERISGKLAWQGGARSLGLELGDARAKLTDARLRGQGAFDGPAGHFEAEAHVAGLESRSAAGIAELSGFGLTLRGKTHDERAVQQLAAALTLGVKDAAVSTYAQGDIASTVALRDVSLKADSAGPVAAWSDKHLPSLHAELAVARVASTDGGQGAAQRVLMGDVSAQLSGRDLAPDAQSPTGARGDAELALQVPELRVYQGSLPRARTTPDGQRDRRDVDRAEPARGEPMPPGAAIALQRVALRTQLPLSLARAAAELEIASGSTAGATFKGLTLANELQEPMAWLPDRQGKAELHLRGRALQWTQRAQDSAANSGKLESLSLVARKDEGRYQLELDTVSTGLRLGGMQLPGRLEATLRAGLEPDADHGAATLALRGAGGAAVDVSLDGTFAKKDERLRYRADLSVEKLDAFAALIEGAVPRASSVAIPRTRIRGAAHGDLAGLMSRTREGALAVSPQPLATVRGQQALELEVSGLDFRTPERQIVVPKLSLRLSSVHGAAGAGRGEARFRAESLQYDGGGTSVRIEGLDQTVSAEFAKAPDQGLVDVHSKLAIGSLAQSFLPAYRVAGLSFDTHLQVERLRSIFLRELALHNPIAGTRLTAAGVLELSPHEELAEGAQGERDTIAGREALLLQGRLQQELAPFEELGFAARASGRVEVPFRVESGGLLGYRLLAALEAKQVSLLSKDEGVGIEDLNGVVPVVEELALLPSGLVVSAGPRASPLSETRFFDVHPFLSGNDYLTARSIQLRGLQPLGPLAANVRIDRSDFLIDQLQVGWSSGQITGQVRMAYREGDPLVRMRLNATGLRAGSSGDPFDANAALSFVPNAMTLDGKVQLVRVSRAHLLAVLDMIDPFRESASANRVRMGLTFGYPKFVRFQLHDGAVDTKVELGGAASVVRIDEIRAVPLGPILQRYVVPTLSNYVKPNKEPIAAEGSR